MTEGRSPGHVVALDYLRVLGALSVFSFHFLQDARVYDPSVAAGGVLGLWSRNAGGIGVDVFLMVSGVGLLWAWRSSVSPAAFVKRRLARLYPEYWWIAVPLLLLAVVAGQLPASEWWKVPFWLTGTGFLSAATFHPLVDSWWYIGLALQVVLVFGLLEVVARRIGPGWGVVLGAVVSGVCALAVVRMQHEYLLQGFVGVRLFEVMCGIYLAEAWNRRSLGWRGVPAAALAVVGAAVAQLAIVGLEVPEPTLRVVLVFVVAYVLLSLESRLSSGRTTVPVFLGGITYAFFLSHSPWASRVIASMGPSGATWWLAAAVSLGVATAVAVAFHLSFAAAKRLAVSRFKGRGSAL